MWPAPLPHALGFPTTFGSRPAHLHAFPSYPPYSPPPVGVLQEMCGEEGPLRGAGSGAQQQRSRVGPKDLGRGMWQGPGVHLHYCYLKPTHRGACSPLSVGRWTSPMGRTVCSLSSSGQVAKSDCRHQITSDPILIMGWDRPRRAWIWPAGQFADLLSTHTWPRRPLGGPVAPEELALQCLAPRTYLTWGVTAFRSGLHASRLAKGVSNLPSSRIP